MSNLYPGDRVSPLEAGRLLTEQAKEIVRRRRPVMHCPSCVQDESVRVDTGCPNPEEPGETLVFYVCQNCDYGINDHTEGECSCVE